MLHTTLRLFVSGHVQGVSWRAHARHTALTLGLHGWVRNLDDGRVEVLLQGDRAALQHFLAWARQGPPQARVDHLAQHWSESPVMLQGFRIRADASPPH